MKIRTHLSTKPNGTGRNNRRTSVTIHETANTQRGANADAHARLQAGGNNRVASWHYQVDDKEAVQSFNHVESLYHCGHSAGNRDSIAIEICVNSDGVYSKAVDNAARLTAQVLKIEKLTVGDVVHHKSWSGKQCPSRLLSGSYGISWNNFLNLVSKYLKEGTTPSVESTPKPNLSSGSVVDTLNSLGIDSSFTNRIKLYKRHVGTDVYRGTAEQNQRLNYYFKHNSSNSKLEVGSLVSVSHDATHYATGERIASFVKGSMYSIHQLKSDRALLGGIMSWVWLSDLEVR